MKRFVLFFGLVLTASSCSSENPFFREPVYCLTPGTAFQPKYREYADVVVNDVCDDTVHYLNSGWYSYYSY